MNRVTRSGARRELEEQVLGEVADVVDAHVRGG